MFVDEPDNRDDAGRFLPGKSGNPKGRAKRTAALAIAISEFDEDYRRRLHSIALEGEHKDSVSAIKLLWAYAHGNPAQVVTGDDGGPVRFGLVILPSEENVSE